MTCVLFSLPISPLSPPIPTVPTSLATLAQAIGSATGSSDWQKSGEETKQAGADAIREAFNNAPGDGSGKAGIFEVYVPFSCLCDSFERLNILTSWENMSLTRLFRHNIGSKQRILQL